MGALSSAKTAHSPAESPGQAPGARASAAASWSPQQDAWEPMLAVASAAGGSWPDRANAAALALPADAAGSNGEQSLEIRLLSDIRTIFEDMPHVGFLGTNTLLAKLREIEHPPWGASSSPPGS